MKIFPIRRDVLIVVTITALALSLDRIVISAVAGLAVPAFTLSQWDHYAQEHGYAIPGADDHFKAGAGFVGLAVVLALLIRWGDKFVAQADVPGALASTMVAVIIFFRGSVALSKFACKVWNLPSRH